MYETALIVHNVLRLAALVFAVWIVLRSLAGWLGNKPYTSADRLGARILTILVDVQFVLGLLLHLVWSPVTKNAFQDMKAAMGDSSVRKFLVEHPVMMIAAIALVHAGKVMAKKSTVDRVRHRHIVVFVGIAILLFVFGTSWPWSAVPRPWLRIPG